MYKACRQGGNDLLKEIQMFCGLQESPSRRYISLFCSELKNMLYQKYNLTDQQLNVLFPGKETREHKTDCLLMALANRKNNVTFMGDDVESIDPKRLYVTSQGFFHDINDLVTYMTRSEDVNIEPHDVTKTIQIWKNAKEKKRIFNHPGLHPRKKQDYEKMLARVKTLVKNPLTCISPVIYRRAVQYIGDIAFLFFWNDNVKVTYQCYAFLSDFLASLHEKERAVILSLRNNKAPSLQTILKSRAVCNNGVARQLMLVYLYHTRLLKIKPLPFYLNASDDGNTYRVTVRGGPFLNTWSEEIFQYNPTDAKIIYYHNKWIKPTASYTDYMRKNEIELREKMNISAI